INAQQPVRRSAPEIILKPNCIQYRLNGQPYLAWLLVAIMFYYLRIAVQYIQPVGSTDQEMSRTPGHKIVQTNVFDKIAGKAVQKNRAFRFSIHLDHTTDRAEPQYAVIDRINGSQFV